MLHYLFPPTKLQPHEPDDPDASIGGLVGTAVAISGDGRTIVAGAPGQSFAAVFVRYRLTWVQQAILNYEFRNDVSLLGTSVAISYDGNTILVGGPGDDPSGVQSGSAWVYVRTGTTWTEQAKLKATMLDGTSRFGGSVALSADGNTALIGDPAARRTVQAWQLQTGPPIYSLDEGDADGAGVAYVFTRDAGDWSITDILFPPHTVDEGPFLDSSPPVADFHVTGGGFGGSVTLSADGNVAVCSEPANFHAVDPLTLLPGSVLESELGSVYSFHRSSGSWGMVSNRVELTGHFADTGGLTWQLGFAVRLSPGGSRLAVAGLKQVLTPSDEPNVLDTWLYSVDPDGTIIDSAPQALRLGSQAFPSINGYAWSAEGSLFAFGSPALGLAVAGRVGLPLADDATSTFGTSIDVSHDARQVVVGDPGAPVDGTGGFAWAYMVKPLAVSFDGIEYAG